MRAVLVLVALVLLLPAPGAAAVASQSSFVVASGLPQEYRLFVPGDGPVVLELRVQQAAYRLLTLDGPGDCQGTPVPGAREIEGAQVGPGSPLRISCGRLGPGTYAVTLEVRTGTARGLLRAEGGMLRAA